MNENKNPALTAQKDDRPLMTIVRVLGIALVIILGMLIASGVLFNAFVVQAIAP